LRMRSSRLVSDVELARSSSTATAMLDKPDADDCEPPRQAEHPVDLFERWCPPVLARHALPAYCSVNGMIGMSRGAAGRA
jgi:hypothetical protein